MSSLIPGSIAWPLTVCVAVFALGRFALFRDTVVDRLVNGVFAWSAAGLLLYRCAQVIGVFGPVDAAAIGCVVMATTYLYAIGYVRMSDIEPDALRRRVSRRSVVAVASAVAVLIAGSVATSEGRTADLGQTWNGLVIALAIGVPVLINTGVFGVMVLREFRTDPLTGAERVVGAVMIISTLFTWSAVLLSGLQLATGRPQLGSHLQRAELAFTVGVAINGIAPAFPLWMAMMRVLGLDRDGRACRRLGPLWRDLTAAVPEIVMHPGAEPGAARDPATRVLRMTVEIRDALLHLTPYLPPEQRSEKGCGTADYARRIASAARARQAGIAPEYATACTPLPRGGSDFDTDLGQLLDLARVWRSVAANRQGRRRPERDP